MRREFFRLAPPVVQHGGGDRSPARACGVLPVCRSLAGARATRGFAASCRDPCHPRGRRPCRMLRKVTEKIKAGFLLIRPQIGGDARGQRAWRGMPSKSVDPVASRQLGPRGWSAEILEGRFPSGSPPARDGDFLRNGAQVRRRPRSASVSCAFVNGVGIQFDPAGVRQLDEPAGGGLASALQISRRQFHALPVPTRRKR